VIYLLNHLSHKSLNDTTPFQAMFHKKLDVSPLLQFGFWDCVYFDNDDGHFPSETREATGRWVGVAETKGDILTYWVLSDRTGKALPRSNVQPLVEGPRDRPFTDRNLRAERDSGVDIESESVPEGEVSAPTESSEETPAEGELPDKEFIKSFGFCNESGPATLPLFLADNLVGQTVLLDKEDGQVLRYTMTKKIVEQDDENKTRIKFMLSVPDGSVEELIDYNKLSDLVERQNNAERDFGQNGSSDEYYSFEEILHHVGPLTQSDPRYKGSKYNVIVKWTTGEQTLEPLAMMIKYDPVTMAEYGQRHGLLDQEGWLRLRRYFKNMKKFKRMVKAAK
jgi:hypothetical protein